jgi:hypothetical protein
MKTKIILSSIVYFGICVLVFNACCKKKCSDPSNPECGNYDPCYKAKPNANFFARQTCWSGFDEVWDIEGIKQSINTDTIGDQGVDFVPTYDGRTQCSYEWQFDGSTKIYKDSIIKGAAFYNYYNNWANMLDSNYSKPIGINFKVTCPPNNCVGNDTLFEFRREITFAKREMYEGEFKGTFSNKPNDSVTIGLALFRKLSIAGYGRYAFINWPFYSNDTFYLKHNAMGYSDQSLKYVITSYNQERIYSLDTKQSNIDYIKSGGIIDVVFEGRLGASGKNEVKFKCKQKLNSNAPITEIIFIGYQTKQFYRPIDIL